MHIANEATKDLVKKGLLGGPGSRAALSRREEREAHEPRFQEGMRDMKQRLESTTDELPPFSVHPPGYTVDASPHSPRVCHFPNPFLQLRVIFL